MDNDVIKSKFNQLAQLKEELDGLVWIALKHYLEATGILFNGPEDWAYEEDGCIAVSGDDGCMGSYDRMSVCFGLDWIFDPEGCSSRVKAEKAAKRKAEQLARVTAQEEKDKLEYERLQAKFKDKEK